MISGVCRWHCLSKLCFILATLGALSIPDRARAAETEVREFTIEVDGKARGQYDLTITKQDDGVHSVHSVAALSVKTILGTYKYSFDGTEHWKDSRLIQLTSQCNDDGTETKVSAMADKELLRVTVNGKDRNCRWDVWTTSYWKLADQRFHNKDVPLLDNDTGKEYVAQLKYIGVEPLNVGGQAQKCYHFRVTGGPTSPTDLWYDGQHRLVRQEFTDHGKRVLFILRAVRR
jgi:hypothetical protein